MNPYLAASSIIDFDSPAIQALLDAAGWRDLSPRAAAERAYLFVRDEVGHSYDVCDPRVTVSAGEALRDGVGLCYSKAHLLAALLRGLGIPAAIRYQRLRLDEGFCLHAFNSAWLDDAWHDLDARGNNERVAAEFLGALAFAPDASLGEEMLPDYFAEPLPRVVEALAGTGDVLTMKLPD